MPPQDFTPDARSDRWAMFQVTRTADPTEFDTRSRISQRMPSTGQLYRYHLTDPALWRARFERPIFALAARGAGPIVVSHARSRFATEVGFDGAASPLFCLILPRSGEVTLHDHAGRATTAGGGGALAWRPGADNRLAMSDDCARANLFIAVREVEAALERALDRPLRAPLTFRQEVDWSAGLPASLRRQIAFVIEDFGRPGGVADNPLALAATTDLLAALLLAALPHSHSEALALRAQAGPSPAYLHRAEAFLRAHATEPLRLADIAAAAGCSVRTLTAVYRRFRATTPLAALHAARLDAVRLALLSGATGETIAELARRHGFTNATRFGAAYRRRFGERPSEARRRTGQGPRSGAA